MIWNKLRGLVSMGAMASTVISLAYILGLLLTALSGQFLHLPLGAIIVLVASIGLSIFAPRFWKTGPRSRMWLIAGVVSFLAVLHFQIRVPHPGPQDISLLISSSDEPTLTQPIKVQGIIDTPPHLTRSQKVQFWLNVSNVDEIASNSSEPAIAGLEASGRLYVTVPLLQGTGLHSGQTVAITGSLYKPKPASNPGGFDFAAYLAQQGGFAGLYGKTIDFPMGEKAEGWGWWSIRQRIVRSQVHGLGVPEGPLVSAMVMGRDGVDLPYDLRDQFTQVGLAHALAASGFQVSLLIGVTLALTQKLSAKIRLLLGVSVLVIYTGLTGIQPSVLRADVMGFAALYALTAERKVKPLGSLLLSAVVLLLFNPLWIWDLGFQLSFLATLGLLVTVQPLIKMMDWLPPAIATLIAVPIAAFVWTLPLQIQVFGTISPYSIVINILATPLITVLSIGGMISALGALMWPPIGSFLAWLLYYPSHFLIEAIEFCNHLPGTSFATGTISVAQTLVLYALFGLIWWQVRWHRYWWVTGIAAVSLVAIPAWQSNLNLVQATVLATSSDPVLVIQDKGSVGLVNSGTDESAHFTVLPFLRQQGVNQLSWAIATSSQLTTTGWYRILEALPVHNFYINSHDASQDKGASDRHSTITSSLATTAPGQVELLRSTESHKGRHQVLALGASLQLGSAQVELLNQNPAVLVVHVGNVKWLLLQHVPLLDQQTLVRTQDIPPVQVLWWSGEGLSPDLLNKLNVKVAIASAQSIDSTTETWLHEHAIAIYCTGQDGAIQWTPQSGFSTALDMLENRSSSSL